MRQSRISKSEAARRLAISRRTVIRLAQKGDVTCDRRGRVLFSEVARAWQRPSAKGERWRQRARKHRPIVLWRGAYWSAARLVRNSEWLSAAGEDTFIAYLRKYSGSNAEQAVRAYLKQVEDSLFLEAIKQTTPRPQPG